MFPIPSELSVQKFLHHLERGHFRNQCVFAQSTTMAALFFISCVSLLFTKDRAIFF